MDARRIIGWRYIAGIEGVFLLAGIGLRLDRMRDCKTLCFQPDQNHIYQVIPWN